MFGLRTDGGEAGGAEEIIDASCPLPWPRGEGIRAVTSDHILTRKPLEAYLKLQGRFRHLFEPTRQDEVIRYIQGWVDAYRQDAKKTGTAFCKATRWISAREV